MRSNDDDAACRACGRLIEAAAASCRESDRLLLIMRDEILRLKEISETVQLDFDRIQNFATNLELQEKAHDASRSEMKRLEAVLIQLESEIKEMASAHQDIRAQQLILYRKAHAPGSPLAGLTLLERLHWLVFGGLPD